MKMRRRVISVYVAQSLAVLAACAAVAGAQVPASQPASVISTLRRDHPRLILTPERLAELERLSASDALLRRYRRDVLARADAYCDKPPLKFTATGKPILGLSRECQQRVYALSLAWRLTGKDIYARAARENMLAVCEFRDWNPTHFLDTAEMCHALGIGYDWLYDYLGQDDRKTIRQAIVDKALKPALKRYRRKGWSWARRAPNWIQVCHGGLIIGSLAVAEDYPAEAEKIIAKALERLPVAMANYAPNGAWPEGLGYWHYATRYAAYGLSALQTGLGTDFGLSKSRGLDQTGLFPIYGTGPTGLLLNFADVGDRSRRGQMPCMFYLAGLYDNPAFADIERRALADVPAEVEDFIWYVPADTGPRPTLPLDRLFKGSVAVASFRSAWDNPDALFLGVKAGFNQAGHGHLDLGSFELDALGVRWARDLGSDSYSLPAYFSMGQTGRRWTYFRAGSFSHNVPTLGRANQHHLAKTEMIRFDSKPARGMAIVDLTSAYKDYSTKTTRGVALTAGRRAFLIQDEFEIPKPCEVAWGMTTDATIATDGGQATLSLEGKELKARILAPQGAVFVAESAEQEPPQRTNKGVSRLMIRLKGATGGVRIVVLLEPVRPGAKAVEPPKITPLAKW